MQIIISIFISILVMFNNINSSENNSNSNNYSDFTFNCPVDSGKIVSNFGERKHPILDTSVFHNGIDISSPAGRKVYSVNDGYVSYIGDNKIYGLNIHIDHDSIFTSTYSHLSKILIDKGKRVKKGDVIGLVGKTGLVTAAHLHFEIHKNGTPVNPIIYMKCSTIKIKTRFHD